MKQFNIHFSDEVHEALRQASYAYRITKSDIVRDAVTTWLRNNTMQWAAEDTAPPEYQHPDE